ncbi:hypothetical protein [Polyangium aurulentum]|uniref:hypothetical protein n=1 Tax=Polyangium aurulentum TaxID=2567896 RepID=UPI0010AE578D|nr:hypothetical protein [Polyangium aurulentum]UQA58695.1 hypothetical protein E8A73_046940 [Polyangium aurulentum]
MSDPIVIKIPLDKPAIPVDVAPGTEIVLRGFYTSRHDGSVIDAATTTWPKEAPGGASVDAGGFIDLESGGFHLTSRDIAKHEIHAVATGKGGEACAAVGVSAPCLPLRTRPAVSRLMTQSEWAASLDGAGIEVVLPPPPIVAAPPGAVPFLQVGAGIVVAAVVGLGALRWRKRRAASPEGQLVALAEALRKKLARADQVLAAPLAPAVEAALKAVRERRVDARSAEGRRVAEVLRRVDMRIEESIRQARAEEEQQAADELVQEMESALEAADEVKRTHA